MIAEALVCTALTIFNEARGEPWAGRMAVALVLRNRAKQHNHGLCWEAFRDHQFSWTNDRDNLQVFPSGPAWIDAVQIARTALNTPWDFTNGATHYHTLDVHPAWDVNLEQVGIWGNHVFFKEKDMREVSLATKIRPDRMDGTYLASVFRVRIK